MLPRLPTVLPWAWWSPSSRTSFKLALSEEGEEENWIDSCLYHVWRLKCVMLYELFLYHTNTLMHVEMFDSVPNKPSQVADSSPGDVQ